jgi:hypothetical protein
MECEYSNDVLMPGVKNLLSALKSVHILTVVNNTYMGLQLTKTTYLSVLRSPHGTVSLTVTIRTASNTFLLRTRHFCESSVLIRTSRTKLLRDSAVVVG